MAPNSTIPTNCDNCGACCMGQNLLPLSVATIDSAYRRTIPARLLDDLRRVGVACFGDDNCPCIWLDRISGKCKHYKHRPETCREIVKVGDETCMRIRRKVRVK